MWNWFSLLANIVFIFTMGFLFEDTLNKNFSSSNLVMKGFIMIAMIILRAIFDLLAGKSSHKSSILVKKKLREMIYKKLLRLGNSYKEKVSTSEVVQVSTEGIEQLEIYFGRYLPQLFYSLLAPITLFVILSFISFKSAIILLICVPLIPVSIIMIQKFAKKLLNKYWGIYTGLGDSFLENLQGLTTLKIYQADEVKVKEMDEEAELFRKVTMRVLTMQLNSISVMDLIAYGGAALGIITAFLEFQHGNISFSGVIIILLLASDFFIPLRLLGSFFHIAMNGMAASDKMFRLLEMEEEEVGTKDIENIDMGITFNNIEFSYEENRKILNNISFDVPKGSFVSIVGESGCGKSTIASLLMGRLKKYNGSIFVGGVPLSELSEENIMKHITMVSHNSYLFKGTVEENLKMANPNATKKQMEEALKTVNLLEFLNGQEGLKTKLQEKGENFSGGQRQRLAMARALLHDSEIYIFDEATSNIDMESENQIMEAIKILAKTKTVILISHRLANVVDSSIIYVLKNGEIEERGTHKQLLENKKHYYNLYESQCALETYEKNKKGGVNHA